MKYLALVSVFLFFLCLTGCGQRQKYIESWKEDLNLNLFVFEYDGCEYLAASPWYSGLFTHKGNCKYCEQRARNKGELNGK